MNVMTARRYKISLLCMIAIVSALSVYSYTVNEKIRVVNRMLEREMLRSEALLGEKLMLEKALVKANVRLASFGHQSAAKGAGSDLK